MGQLLFFSASGDKSTVFLHGKSVSAFRRIKENDKDGFVQNISESYQYIFQRVRNCLLTLGMAEMHDIIVSGLQ